MRTVIRMSYDRDCKIWDFTMLACPDGKKAIGRAELEKIDGRYQWELNGVWITPKLRRQGLGRTITEFALKFADEKRWKVSLDCDKHLLAFYSSLGFCCEGPYDKTWGQIMKRGRKS